jgi:hypothetical protein
MPAIINDGKVATWVEAFTGGCQCGGRTVAQSDASAVMVKHYPPGEDTPWLAWVIGLADLQVQPDATLERYRRWIESAHEMEGKLS